MRCNYIREKKYQCGDDYMAVGVFSIIPQEHRGRGKKRKESSEGQKAKNKMDSLRKRQRKALTNFSPAGMFLTGTYEDPFLPEDILACRRDVENYKRRVMAATCKRGGVYKPGGVTRMEMELCQKRIRHPMKLPDQPAKVKRKPIGGVIDPSALAYDVHDLMIYNEKARKIGKPELTYGYWAEKGKPATP